MAEEVREPDNTISGGWLDEGRIAHRQELFKIYVEPYLNLIFKLCINYSYSRCNVKDNYTEVLANFYRHIETYNPEKSILTWLSVITKRHIVDIEKRRRRIEEADDVVIVEDCSAYDFYEETEVSNNVMGVDNYRSLYNDDILQVLDAMKPIHRDAIILQEAGFTLREIAEIEFEKGTLKSKNIDTIKSRLLCARKYLKQHIDRNGERKTG